MNSLIRSDFGSLGSVGKNEGIDQRAHRSRSIRALLASRAHPSRVSLTPSGAPRAPRRRDARAPSAPKLYLERVRIQPPAPNLKWMVVSRREAHSTFSGRRLCALCALYLRAWAAPHRDRPEWEAWRASRKPIFSAAVLEAGASVENRCGEVFQRPPRRRGGHSPGKLDVLKNTDKFNVYISPELANEVREVEFLHELSAGQAAQRGE